MFQALWRKVLKTNINYSKPCINQLSVRLLNVKEQSTVAVDESYVKKFMNAVGWMDKSRTVQYSTYLYLRYTYNRIYSHLPHISNQDLT